MLKIYRNILLDLENIAGVRMLVLADKDGFMLDEHASEDSEILMQLSARMLRIAETITNKLEKSSPKRVIVDFNGGKLITASAGPKALIAVMASQDAKIDLIISELEKTAWKIKEIL